MTSSVTARPFEDLERAGDSARAAGRHEEAIAAYLAAYEACAAPSSGLCLNAARSCHALQDEEGTRRWIGAAVDAADDFKTWWAAASLARKAWRDHPPPRTRQAGLALLASHTVNPFSQLLLVAGLRAGLWLDVRECPYGQYRQQILDEDSDLYRNPPDYVLLAVTAQELQLPGLSGAPEADLAAEVERWVSLWDVFRRRSQGALAQWNFVAPSDHPLGHLGSKLPGSRYRLTMELNTELARRSASDVALIDCDRVAADYGKGRWFDPRYWHMAKQPVALDALPLLARHTAAVLAGLAGLSKKCLVLDLDNTLWGGVIGEDRLSGIRLGYGADGEGFMAFQEYILGLKRKGILLAVCSKNNEADAREPFEQHPDMRIRIHDLAMFVANWNPKPDNLRMIAESLNLGLDSMVFVDDNPAECRLMNQMLPQVETINLPADPTLYSRTLNRCLLFETGALTAEDAHRTEQYRARARALELQQSSGSMPDFYRSLRMQVTIEPFSEMNLARISQLVGKTNQFNLTTRRHSLAELRAFADAPGSIHAAFRMVDSTGDHGLVGVLIALVRGDTVEIDSWLMSCRVIGRTLEAAMLNYLCLRAADAGCTQIRGAYIQTAKNSMVKDVYSRFGFRRDGEAGDAEWWSYDLSRNGPIPNEYISVSFT